MRLGDIGQEATIEASPESPHPLKKAVLCLAVGVLGVAALGARFGSPIIHAEDEQTFVRETIIKLPFAAAEWHTLSSDHWMVALPIIHTVHKVNRKRQTRSLSVVAQTKTGLKTRVGPMVLDFAVPRHGAQQYLDYIGPHQGALDTFIKGAVTIATRSVFSQSADATIDAPIELNDLRPKIREKLGDVLSEAGIELKSLSIAGLRFDTSVHALIQRLRASRLRINVARERRKDQETKHAQALRTSKEAHASRLANLDATYTPRIDEAHSDSAQRRKAAEFSFQDTKNQALLHRRAASIRADAFEYRIRKEAEALSLRVKGTKDASQQVIDYEIGRRILPQLDTVPSPSKKSEERTTHSSEATP